MKYLTLLFLPLVLLLEGCGSLLPAVYPVASSIAATAIPENDTVIFIGDSITANLGSQAFFRLHPKWVNKGIAGENSDAIAQRYQRDVVDHHPGTVHILMGTNDVYPSWMLCNTRGARATATTPPPIKKAGDLPDTCANVYYMLETAKRNKIKVVIGTIPPWGCADVPVCGMSIVDKSSLRYVRISQLNNWLKTFAAEEGAVVADYHTELTNDEGKHYAMGLTSDGVHPNSAGYDMMQPLIVRSIEP